MSGVPRLLDEVHWLMEEQEPTSRKLVPTIGMIVRQRPKQHGVRHAEHRHVAADAERQREDDHSREQRSSGEGANAYLKSRMTLPTMTMVVPSCKRAAVSERN